MDSSNYRANTTKGPQGERRCTHLRAVLAVCNWGGGENPASLTTWEDWGLSLACLNCTLQVPHAQPRIKNYGSSYCLLTKMLSFCRFHMSWDFPMRVALSKDDPLDMWWRCSCISVLLRGFPIVHLVGTALGSKFLPLFGTIISKSWSLNTCLDKVKNCAFLLKAEAEARVATLRWVLKPWSIIF